MGKTYTEIDAELAAWIRRQKMFFVATAPLKGELINCSPKGLDTLQILGSRELAYVDIGGSGIETVAHIKENGRIVLMMCAFEGPPKIYRFYGRGTVVAAHENQFLELLQHFPEPPVCRAIVRIAITRIQDACGFGVPLYDFKKQRDTLPRYVAAKTSNELNASIAKYSAASIEGLPGLTITDGVFAGRGHAGD
ncbi:MAG: pyridoxamine 5'-phosphate oxidase family protein [Betaproteobacteria bacterium]|nr:pyridoxamine 5'-phosphate oxidase family protein [Betaproteobacteria bacterium]